MQKPLLAKNRFFANLGWKAKPQLGNNGGGI